MKTAIPTGNDPLAPIITLCGGSVGPFKDIGELQILTEETLSPSVQPGLVVGADRLVCSWGLGIRVKQKHT